MQSSNIIYYTSLLSLASKLYLHFAFNSYISTLPHLEVQCLDAIRVQESEKNRKTNQNHCNWPFEVGIISKMILNICFDHRLCRSSGHCNSTRHVSVLAYNQTVHSPRHRTNPVIPYPPLGNFLEKKKKNLSC